MDCCSNGDHVPCQGPYGCEDHPQGEEFCPGNPNLKRMGQEFGYMADASNILPYDRAIQFCSANMVIVFISGSIQDQAVFMQPD